jgi:phospholipid-binding lipoprotein MlaA
MDEDFADPYERMNRNVYAFNDAVDKAAVKPVAKGYQKVIPKGLRLCASNMFSNLGEPYTAANNLLQGKPKSMLQDIGRLLLNSTLGIGGCIDVASAWGIPKHQEDFGQTLAVWGVPSGPYVVLPVLGPSTVRDALSKPVDFLANPIGYVTNVPLRNSLQGYKMLDTRTNLLEASDVVDQSALDPYVMVRDAWLQRRLAQIKDDDGSYNDSNDVPRKLELAPRSAVIQ